MQHMHNTLERTPLTRNLSATYIAFIDGRRTKPVRQRDFSMAASFFRNAFNRVVEARERQVARYVNGALLNLDDETLKTLGTSREELRRKGATSYVF